jgi:hypothetical protein
MDVLGQVLPLALLDTLSLSTLAIPLWFLLTPRGLKVANVLFYLLIVGVGYLLLGVALMGGLSTAREPLSAALDSAAGDVVVTVVGIALLLGALWCGLVKRPPSGEAGRFSHWRDAAVGEYATLRGVVVLALVAVALEVPTMFPYLVAIDVLARDGYSWIARCGVLTLYCLVMVAPATLALLLRTSFSRIALPLLHRVDRSLRKNAREDTAWLMALVGVVILSNTSLFGWVTEVVAG